MGFLTDFLCLEFLDLFNGVMDILAGGFLVLDDWGDCVSWWGLLMEGGFSGSMVTIQYTVTHILWLFR